MFVFGLRSLVERTGSGWVCPILVPSSETFQAYVTKLRRRSTLGPKPRFSLLMGCCLSRCCTHDLIPRARRLPSLSSDSDPNCCCPSSGHAAAPLPRCSPPLAQLQGGARRWMQLPYVSPKHPQNLTYTHTHKHKHKSRVTSSGSANPG